MQVSGAYTAVGSIFEVHSAQRSRRAASSPARSSGDTVSISDEALTAYKNSLQKAGGGTTLDAQSEARLTSWFDQWHSGAKFSTKGGGVAGGSNAGALLPENAALKASLEKEIDRHLRDANYRPGAPAAAELLDKLRPLQQKLNVMASLGGSKILDEETLETAAKFLQALEDAWNGGQAGETSLGSRFISGISSWKTQAQDGYALQEKLAALRDDALETAQPQKPDAATQFGEQFAAYRGKGIFAHNDDEGPRASAGSAGNMQAGEAERSGAKASELERKIKDLTAQLETVMASPMPEMEKTAMSNHISKEIEELQSQLTARKQAERASAGGAA